MTDRQPAALDPRLHQAPTCLIFDPRPTQAPPGWLIMNSARPLWGSAAWEGDWYSGVHYAALDPADADYGHMLRANLELRAKVLHYLPLRAAKPLLCHHYRGLSGLAPQVLSEILIDIDAMTDLDASTHVRELTYSRPYAALLDLLHVAGVAP